MSRMLNGVSMAAIGFCVSGADGGVSAGGAAAWSLSIVSMFSFRVVVRR
jgi:hypothetical protein